MNRHFTRSPKAKTQLKENLFGSSLIPECWTISQNSSSFPLSFKNGTVTVTVSTATGKKGVGVSLRQHTCDAKEDIVVILTLRCHRLLRFYCCFLNKKCHCCCCCCVFPCVHALYCLVTHNMLRVCCRCKHNWFSHQTNELPV